MPSLRGKLLFVSCDSGRYLGRQVRDEYNRLLSENGINLEVPYVEEVTKYFACKEICPRLPINVRGTDTYVFAALENPTREVSLHDNLMELLLMIRTLKEHQARTVTSVIPYYVYSRQEKATKFQREPISAKLIAEMLELAGVDDVITWDLHADAITGFFKEANCTALNAFDFFLDEYEKYRGNEDTILFAVDARAVNIIDNYSVALDLPFAMASKVRPGVNLAEIRGVIGDFEGKRRAIIIDDMVDTGGSLAAAISELRANGIQEIYIGASHTLLNPPALERLDEAFEQFGLQELYTTNSIPQIPEIRNKPYYKESPLAPFLTQTINRMHYEESVSQAFFRPEG